MSKYKIIDLKVKLPYNDKYIPDSQKDPETQINVKFSDGTTGIYTFYESGKIKSKSIMHDISDESVFEESYHENGTVSARGHWRNTIPPIKMKDWEYFDEKGEKVLPPVEDKTGMIL
ncbi:MAG: hypothetical protein IKS41_05330 [Alphaproteobacteria bacterium]|nr:hypothetical protein [Alphaproteobacteria bacterium]